MTSFSNHPRRPQEGFTLVEVMVAVTLVAMMAVGLWAVLRISIKSWSKGTEYIDTNQRHRSILDMVRKQIASACNLAAPRDPALPGNNIRYPIFSGTETGFRFISLNSLQFHESPGLTLVTYEVAQGPQGDYSMVEKEDRYVGRIPDQPDPAVQNGSTSILSDLVDCSFEYFDPGDNNNPARWVNEWDAKETGRLPAAVMMTMNSRDSKGNMLNRRMIVPIQAATGNTGIGLFNPFGSVRGNLRITRGER